MNFQEIAILLVAAGFFGIIAKLIKQPILIGYLFAGFFLAATGFVGDNTYLQNLGKIGITLLLFLLGMEIKIHELFQFGKTTLVSSLVQIIVSSILAFFLSLMMGFDFIASLYIAFSLSFSSTIVVIKLLSEKKDLASFYGRLTVGILLIQDLVVILLLMFLSSAKSYDVGIINYALVGVKGVVLLFLVWFLSRRILPRLFERFISSSQELLFVGSIAWALGIALFIAGPLGFTLEIGGFLAGLSLSNLPEHVEIASRTRPLRDFFLVIFFLYLGTQLAIGQTMLYVIPQALILSLFVLVGKPLIVMTTLGILGYKKRTSLLTGLSLAQISEFSLILVALGGSLGHIKREVVSMVVLSGAITMTFSTYMILYADKIYRLVGKYLSIFERKKAREEVLVSTPKMIDHIVLVGCDRTGRNLVNYFIKKNVPFLVIDFNPKVFTALSAQKIPVIFGDVSDSDILQTANVASARMLISTSGNLADNLSLLEYVSQTNRDLITIFTAPLRLDALALYENGASYVIVPEVVAGEHIRHLLRIYGTKGEKLVKAGKSHFNRLMFT
ncbi:MAG: Transporter, CPA2 family [Candidatus Woesebacteria bacterium GW2011_GWB1_39_12]|uniref:Transporter, CPA2 family n=2 Tax=Candidatus Woeseibacteriota TaxID=1752722 RepID=A0A0G0Q9V5_9BACT|nr:MAG: Transporter, CPA2 family [Candidatus Woesebacteria bacterium GW2011_GWA1_39_12]KKR00689.1 MAG: Transporter, CPA2 family [Candidatus Woesebacteria bacterium GW2011_GWB1_39_12]